jgi:glycosyltransferase involved in cell wall biosynthesis
MAEKSICEIVVHGKKSHDEIMEIMSKSHIFIYPSTYPEGLPTVILEAAANSMAIMVYEDVPGMQSAGKAQAVDICSRDNMDEHLAALLSSRDQMLLFGENALKYVRQNHNWQTIAARFVSLELR